MCKALLLLSTIAIISGCSGGSNPDRELQQKAAAAKQVVSGVSFDVIDKENLNFTDSGVTGTGKILALSALTSDKGSAFKISLKLEDNGSVVLHSFTDNKLQNGFDVSIARQGGKLKFTLMSAGKSIDYSEIEGIAAINAIEEIALVMDIHNNESPAHFILWKASESTLDESTALLNSADEPKATPGKGSGLFYGLSLKDATVSFIGALKPHVTH